MVLLCFLLDLRSLSPPILRDLKQSLLQLANYYAVAFQRIHCSCEGTQSTSRPLLDRIGLCYVFRNRISCSDELKVAYNPHGNFNLRDLHHALNNMPTDVFSPKSNESGSIYLKLADLLSEKYIYSWGEQGTNVSRKVILISSFLVGTMDSTAMKVLMDAGDKCVLVEFVLLEQTSSHLGDLSENNNGFVKQIGSMKNCSFQICFPNPQILHGLVKKWFLELKSDEEELLQAHFIFKENFLRTLNQISCNLCTSFHPIADEFQFCQACRCHGIPLDHANMKHMKSSSCPVTGDNLRTIDIVEKSIRVGEQTILHMPSFHGSPRKNQLSSPIEFNVIQRTNLVSLSEGLIMGGTYYVTPAFCATDGNDTSELNNQIFQVICNVLNSLDQGLVCFSNCNIEIGRETSLRCYYILFPSDKGLMLLRRLSASEEFLPISDVSQLFSSIATEEIENTVQASLLKMEVTDYNPFRYERGFHRKLNLFVKESLQFGPILPKGKEGTSESDANQLITDIPPLRHAVDTANNWLQLNTEPGLQPDTELGETKSSPSLAEEWEKLIVTELGGTHSPACTSNSKLDQLLTSPSQTNRQQLDEKTSRILERLENPRQTKRKTTSPTITNSLPPDACTPAKKPLTPYLSSESAGPPSQPMKPNFQRIKRKR